MKINIILLILTQFVINGFCDEIKKEIATCAAIQNSVERLAAYDSLAERIGVAHPVIETNNAVGKWIIKTEISPIDDKQCIYLSLDSEETVSAGYKKGRPCLYIRYKEGQLECYIHYGFFIGSDSTSVTMRMDKKEPRTHNWNISSNHESIFYPSGVKWFVDNLMESKSLVIRLTPYGESPVTASFDLTGIAESIKPIIEALEK
jgi:type VI secretion system protein VasI